MNICEQLKQRELTLPFTYEEKYKSFKFLQEHILEKIDRKEKYFIGRLSGNEGNLLSCVLSGKQISNTLLHNMLDGAGIHFLNNDDIKNYCSTYTKSVVNCDILGIWAGSMYMQSIPYYDFLNKFIPTKQYICAQSLEPYYYMNEIDYKFQEIFENKKVLIITSHSESTKCQMKKDNIFHKRIFHETADIFVYKSVQQNAGNNDDNSWEYHFNKMKNDILHLKNTKFNFDIALVSCGGFGMILCNYIFSELDASVIYVGGSLQLYFGIMGNRWRNNVNILKHINDEWINVLEQDKISSLKQNPSLCENSCYW